MVDPVTVGAVAGAAVAVIAAPVALSAAGFGSIGVLAGSYAAGVQATMGGVVAKGSLFAVCQSWGAAGIPIATQAIIAAAGAPVGYATGAVVAAVPDAARATVGFAAAAARALLPF